MYVDSTVILWQDLFFIYYRVYPRFSLGYLDKEASLVDYPVITIKKIPCCFQELIYFQRLKIKFH